MIKTLLKPNENDHKKTTQNLKENQNQIIR